MTIYPNYWKFWLRMSQSPGSLLSLLGVKLGPASLLFLRFWGSHNRLDVSFLSFQLLVTSPVSLSCWFPLRLNLLGNTDPAETRISQQQDQTCHETDVKSITGLQCCQSSAAARLSALDQDQAVEHLKLSVPSKVTHIGQGLKAGKGAVRIRCRILQWYVPSPYWGLDKFWDIYTEYFV